MSSPTRYEMRKAPCSSGVMYRFPMLAPPEATSQPRKRCPEQGPLMTATSAENGLPAQPPRRRMSTTRRRVLTALAVILVVLGSGAGYWAYTYGWVPYRAEHTTCHDFVGMSAHERQHTVNNMMGTDTPASWRVSMVHYLYTGCVRDDDPEETIGNMYG